MDKTVIQFLIILTSGWIFFGLFLYLIFPNDELLGDKINKWFNRLGIAWIVRTFLPFVSGCDKRKVALNDFHLKILYLAGKRKKIIHYVAAYKFDKESYIAYCYIDEVFYLTHNPREAIHFSTFKKCFEWCKQDTENATPLFTPKTIEVII